MSSCCAIDAPPLGACVLHYGDGASVDILHKLSVQTAKLLVVAISDPASTRRIVAVVRQENPELYIIVRTRYVVEVEDLKALAANEVIPEEFETSVEIFSKVVQQYRYSVYRVYKEHGECIKLLQGRYPVSGEAA